MSGNTTLWSPTIGDVNLPITPTTIDGMTIGGTTPAPATVTTLTATGATTLAAASVTNLTQNGTLIETPQIVTAAGSNSQSGATALTKSLAIVTVVSATTRAARLPKTPTPGQQVTVLNDTAVAVKIYPATNATISSGATNAAAQILARKSALYVAVTATHWAVQAGA